MGREQLDRELRDQLDALCELLHAEPFTTDAVAELGHRLQGLGYLGEPGLRCTTDVLGKGLLAMPEFQPIERYAERIVLALGALACGFTRANERSVLDQQESMQLSLLKAVRDAKWQVKQSEAQFEEVATSSTSGIMIVDMDGRLTKVNAAIGDILGHSPAALTGTLLLDLVHPDAVDGLREAMTELVEGGRDRIRQSQRMLRDDGDVARISLTVSLLRGADDQPAHFVTVVEDGTELMLLQSELKRQALHDVLTGLPNRQFFSSYLEGALRRADPQYGVTVFHLDIDAFGMICNSLGGRVGERLLQHVAQRLHVVLSRETAMIARFDGDEFGILLENSASTPDIGTIVADINRDLAEPTYVDGHGLAVSVSAGVVHRPGLNFDVPELMRAADLALRRAKVGRKGQWDLFHPGQDAEERSAHTLAVVMPGAWEHGEISVHYRPLGDLASGAVTGVEALLRWDRPDVGVLEHDRCAALAEQTGLILPLGEWLLRVATGQAEWWRQRIGFRHPLSLSLTVHQASDDDLVSRVVRVLEDTALPSGQLMIGMPVGVLEVAAAADNLAVLADMGVHMVLDDFGLGPDDLAAAKDHPVRSVRVARRLVERQAPFVTALVPQVREAGLGILVEGIDTEERATWWREAGADTAVGDLYGVACSAGDLVDRLS